SLAGDDVVGVELGPHADFARPAFVIGAARGDFAVAEQLGDAGRRAVFARHLVLTTVLVLLAARQRAGAEAQQREPKQMRKVCRDGHGIGAMIVQLVTAARSAAESAHTERLRPLPRRRAPARGGIRRRSGSGNAEPFRPGSRWRRR